MTINESDIEAPPLKDVRRLFSAPLWAWIVVLFLWLLGGFYLLWKYPLALFGYITLFVSWLAYNFRVVKENERAKPVFLGIIKKLIGSGPVFVLRPLEKLIIFPTGVQQIVFEHAGILTEKEEEGEKTSTVLPVTPVLNFQYPWEDEGLTMAIRNAPPPTKKGLQELKNKIEEPFLDVVRTIGGHETYEWIMQNRIAFVEKVVEKLQEKKDLTQLIRLFQLKNPTVSMKHIDLSDAIKKALEQEAAAPAAGRAIGIKEKETRFGIAEGDAEIIRRKAETIKSFGDIGMQIEALSALRDGLQTGKSSMVIVPPEILSALGKSLGGQVSSEMSKDQLSGLIEALTRKMGEGK